MSYKRIKLMIWCLVAALLFSAGFIWADSNKQKDKGNDKDQNIVEQQQVEHSNKNFNAKEHQDQSKGKTEQKLKKNQGVTTIPAPGPKTQPKVYWVPSGISKAERAEWINGRPPGWQNGNKTGWKGGSLPPGLAKKFNQPQYQPQNWNSWSAQQRLNWRRDLANTREDLLARARRLNISNPNSQLASLYYATDQGVPIYWTRKAVDSAMDRGLTGYEIEQLTRAMTYGAGKNINFSQLGAFINQSLADGVRGNALALGIYQEIDRLTK